MCGRFSATFEFREIKMRWNLQGDMPGFAPRYNIAPSQTVPVIVRGINANELKPMHWGLVPLRAERCVRVVRQRESWVLNRESN